MKRILLFLLAAAALVWAADFKAGLDAYNRGDFAGALREWQPLADQGEAHAQYNLGLLYARGQGVPQDFAKAADWYRKAAEQGVAAAQYNLGLMYANGQGVQKDAQEASKWFLKAAEQNVVVAQVGLARAYYEGEGAFRNYGEAEKWYRKAADEGVASAAFDLAVMYDLGQGVPQNYTDALKWYHKAADAGYAPAFCNIGILYYNAQGVKRDLVQAYEWFLKAQKLGEPRAKELIDATTNKMRPKDMKKAQAVVAAWQPPPKPAAQTNVAALFGAPPATTGQSTLAPSTAVATEPVASANRSAAPGTAAPTPPANTSAANRPRTGIAPPTPPGATPGASNGASAAANQPQTGIAPPATPGATPGAPNGASAPVATTPTTTAAANQPAALPNSPVSSPPPAKPGSANQPALAEASPAPPKPSPAPASVSGPPAQRQDTWTGVSRIIAVGDVHGDYEQFVAVLKSAGLIDAAGNWTGGNAHLVQTGDIVDRGPDSRAVMDLLMKLEKQAAAAGGGVHCLVGNHEAMDIYGDLRYVSPAEFAAFRPGGPQGGPAAYPDTGQDLTAPATLQPGATAMAPEQLPGFAELRAAFGPEGKYGRWIRSHNAIIKIDRTLFVHAGLGPKYADWTMDQINNEVRQELNDFSRLHGGIVTDDEGPLWYTGLAKGNEQQLEPLVDSLLKRFDVDRIVIGHTYAEAAVTPRFNGRVLMIDVGLSRVYDNVGKLACLEIDDGHAYALHRGQGIELPKDENGPDMLRYLEQAAALDPKPSPLLGRIHELMGRSQPRP